MMNRTMTALALALSVSAWTPLAAQEGTAIGSVVEEAGAEIALTDWDDDQIMAEGWSAEEFIDDAEVYGANEEQIGDVENLVVGENGRILAVIIEVGGFLDIGDTHLAVAWDDVRVESLERIYVPVTEENAEQYATVEDYGYGVEEGAGAGLDEAEQAAAGDAVAVPEDLEDSGLVGARQVLVSEVLDTPVFLEGAGEGLAGGVGEGAGAGLAEEEIEGIEGAEAGEAEVAAERRFGEVAGYAAEAGYGVPYGYIQDLIFNEEGELTAVAVEAVYGYGPGIYAYPWYGWGYGWGYGYYGMPYGEDEVAGAAAYDEAALGGFADEGIGATE